MSKSRSRLVVTYEVLKKVLGLPEEVDIVHQEGDPTTERGTFILRSKEPVKNLTFEVAEGCTIPVIDISIVRNEEIKRLEKIVEEYIKEERGSET